MKDLEEDYIHEKRRKYDNEAIENDFVRSYLVKTINSKTPRKPRSEAVVQRCSEKKVGVLENFAKFTGKHLCQSLFLIKLQTSGLQL